MSEGQRREAVAALEKARVVGGAAGAYPQRHQIGGGPVNPNSGPAWKAIGTGDFNGGGQSDILFQNTSSGQVSIWEWTGTAWLAADRSAPIPDQAGQRSALEERIGFGGRLPDQPSAPYCKRGRFMKVERSAERTRKPIARSSRMISIGISTPAGPRLQTFW
jgi:hypothetical protein